MANKTLYCLSTAVLNNCLSCTLTVVWGGEGGRGAPQCDGSTLICPVWPTHMRSRHCFHILNKNCHVTQGNRKCNMQKSFINFPSHLISPLQLSFIYFIHALKSDTLDVISCSCKGSKSQRDAINRQNLYSSLGKPMMSSLLLIKRFAAIIYYTLNTWE